MTTPPSAATLRRLPASLMAKLDALIKENITAGVFPAMSLAILQHGEWLYDVAYGWIEPDSQRPITMNALFDIASITKLFTTTAFLSLVSEGKVALTTPLVEIVPEFGQISPRPISGGQDPHSKQHLNTAPEFVGQSVDPSQITFWHLLTHTSGLPPWRDVYNAAGAAPTPPTEPDPIPRAERWQRGLAAICQYDFVGQPGTIVRYSDIGLLLLGEATSRMHGTPGRVEQAIQARVLQPLTLSEVMFNPVRDHGIPQEQCVPTELDPTWRHRRAWGEVHDENACGVGGVAGHAGIFATARAIAVLGQAWLQHPGIFGITPELAADAKREHAETDGMRRGLGFVLKAHKEAMAGDLLSPNTFGHSGFTGTTLWVDPDAELVIALMTNSVYPGRGKPGTYEFRRAVHTLIAEELVR